MPNNETITLRVPGMTCGHCESAVTNELMALDEVASVEVDLDTKVVTVTGGPFVQQRLAEAIDEAGFDLEQ